MNFNAFVLVTGHLVMLEFFMNIKLDIAPFWKEPWLDSTDTIHSKKRFRDFLLTYACFQCKPYMQNSGRNVFLIWKNQREVNNYNAIIAKWRIKTWMNLILSSYEIFSNAHSLLTLCTVAVFEYQKNQSQRKRTMDRIIISGIYCAMWFYDSLPSLAICLTYSLI